MSAATIWVVLKKELKDHLRDKRTAAMVFLLSILMGPIVLVAFTQFISSIEKKAEAREVFVHGVENAPQLANFFARQDVSIKTPAADFREQIKTGKHEPVLVIPKDFQGNPGNVLVAIQWGMELGLAPMQDSPAFIGGCGLKLSSLRYDPAALRIRPPLLAGAD